MRPKLPLFICLMLVNGMFVNHGSMADFNGIINIDDPSPSSQISGSSKVVDRSDGEGDDKDDDGAGMSEQGSASGSTSSDEATTDFSFVDASTPATTHGITTTQSENFITDQMNTHLFAPSDDVPEKPGNTKEAVNQKDLRVLITELIVTVVVGAVCAFVILIAFLVCRLQKQDEGSYALREGNKNTYQLQGNKGKEVFV